MTELEKLREEVNRLRERVAVLEAGAQWKYLPMPFQPPYPVYPGTTPWSSPGWVQPTITC